jgi:hypothetical protein
VIGVCRIIMLFRVLQMIVSNAVHCMVIVGWIFAIIFLATWSAKFAINGGV